MKPPLLLALLVTLLLAPAACGRSGSTKGDATPSADAAGVDATSTLTGTLAVSGTVSADIGDAGTFDAKGTQQPTPNATVEKLAETFTLPETGDKDAPLLIMEFSDFRCPYCKQFFDETLPDLRKNWIDTGKARLQFYDLPLSNHGYPAIIGAEAAHCAGEQGKFWEMHDTLFAAFDHLTDIMNLKDEKKSMADILGIAKDADVDMAKLTECVESKRYRPIVAELARTALEKDINGTPWFILLAADHAESIPGYVDYPTMLPILEREYSRALGTPIPTDTPAPATPTPVVTAPADVTPKATGKP